MKLSPWQTETLEHLVDSHYQLRIRPWGKRLAYIYDTINHCWDDWPIRLSTAEALVDKNVVQFVQIDTTYGDLCYVPTIGEKNETR